MLPLLLFAQASLTQKISLDEPAMPLRRLLPIVSKAAGVEILASGNVSQDVVLLKVKEQPVGEVLRRIAEEDGAEVEPTKTGFRLVRTTSSERKEHQGALARRIASMRPELESIATTLNQPADERAYRTLYPMLKGEREKVGGSWTRNGSNTSHARMPATRAVMRAIRLVPLDVLANLQEGDSVVYSNLPTKLQRPLPALEDVLRTFRREQNAWADAVTKLGKLEPNQYAEDPFRHADPIDVSPARAVLIVSRTNSADASFVRLVMLDRRGEEVGLASYGLVSTEMQRGMSEFLKPSDGTLVPMSAETKAFLGGLPRRDGTGPEVPTPEAVALLSKPEEYDPLSYGATDLVRDLAGDRPIVAVLPDTVWFVGLFTPGPLKRSNRAMFASMAEAREEGGWLLVRPREPEMTRRNRVDRRVLGTFIRTIVAAKRVPLDAYAEYAWKASGATYDYVGVPMAMLFDDPTFNPDVSWRSLRFYGSLSVVDRAALLSGATKRWVNLSPEQRELASQIVAKDVRSMQVVADGPVVHSPTLWREPTEIYADGFGALTVALSRSEDEPLVCASTTNPAAKQWKRVLDPQNAGHTVAQLNGPAFDRFAIVKRTIYSLQLSARPGFQAGATLEDVALPGSPLKPISELPGDVQAKFEAGRKSAN